MSERVRPLSKKREAEIRQGLAPGNIWIGFPTEYARQLLFELDRARREIARLAEREESA